MTNITMLCANRPKLLKQSLDSLGDMSNAKVMIRNAGINDDTMQVAHDWCDGNGAWQYLPRPDEVAVGTGAARNHVIKLSEEEFGRGDYLYLSDDDVYFKRPDWLYILIQAYEAAWRNGFRVIGAYNHPYHKPIPNEEWTIVPPLNDAPPFHVYPVYALALQSMLMRWEVWDQFGPFRETTPGRVCDGEDVDFGNKIREAGFRLGVINPPLLVNCGVTNSFGQPIPGADMVRDQCPSGVLCE